MNLYLNIFIIIIIINTNLFSNEEHNYFSWLSQKIDVNTSNIEKKGIFAKEKINKDELICVWGGKILNEQEVLNLPKEQIPYVLQIADNLWIGSNVVESADYLNHSCNPNAGLKGQIFLVSLRDIDIGEEITMDYAMAVTKFIGMKDFLCNCKTQNCRKIISENDWKNTELQKKYYGYFSSYIQKK